MNLLNFSIVISAKDEADNISNLLNSLKNIDYPKNKFEIVVVDDSSIDNTSGMVEDVKKELINLRLIKAEGKIYPGKKGALAIGINNTIYDYILITDADCIVSPGWLKSYSLKFSEGYDFLFGNAPFINQQGFINKVSRFENLRTFFLYTTALKLNFPYSVSARNFGFKKSSFYKIKGYENTKETLSGDDDLLIREAYRNKMRIGYIPDNKASVYSKTKRTFKEYLAQKARHTKTSVYYLPVNKIILGGWHLINLISLFSLVLVFLNNWFLLPFIIKILVDIVIIKSNEGKSNYKFSVIEIIYLQVFYELFIVVNFINALVRKDKWK
jgi:cellulose synthase/poly-beta-1,6-N-acetylglucosamine synthase-like glycosyltransferase